MGRKKRSPLKNIGAVETRSTYREALDQPISHPDDTESHKSESDVSEDEEQQEQAWKRR